MRWRRCLGLAVALATLLTAAPAGAEQPETRCTFQGPVPGFRALRIDLAADSDFLLLELHGQRSPRLLNDESSWHLAEGILVIDAATRDIVAHQVLYSGTAAPVIVAEVEGDEVTRQPVAGPEGPWVHSARKARADLPAGSYYVVAFGTGGPSEGTLAQWWGASIYLRGSHSCHSATPGETFDYDHTRFAGGTQVYAAGAGYAEDISLEFDTERPLVVGLMDAGFQGQSSGSVSLDYDMPGASGSQGRAIVPFVSRAGPHEFRASYRGVHPIIGVTGAAVDLPDAQEQEHEASSRAA